MDDGNTFLPATVDSNLFLVCMNNLHPSITYTLEPARNVVLKGKNAQSLNFLDITIILYEDGKLETDIYYKPTNSHQYLDYTSFHQTHVKDNIPFSLAKRIVCFVTDSDQMDYRMRQLRDWLLKCKYPPKVIDKGIHNSKLQGPAPKRTNKNDVIPFVTNHSSNLGTSTITNHIRTLISNKKHGRLKNILENVQVVTSYKQPPNIGKLLTRAKFSDHIPTVVPRVSFKLPPGLFASCADPRCNLCSLGYIQQCESFECANGEIWEIRSHINCNTYNVLYYLVCNICKKESNTGKTEQKLRGRTNDHICKSRNGTGTDKFDKHVYTCRLKHDRLDPPYFKVYAFMALSSKELLETYEKYLHRKGYDTMNRPN